MKTQKDIDWEWDMVNQLKDKFEIREKELEGLIEEYRTKALLIHSVVVPKGTFCLSCEKETATHGIGQTKTVCGKCWNKIIA